MRPVMIMKESCQSYSEVWPIVKSTVFTLTACVYLWFIIFNFFVKHVYCL